MGSLYGFGTMGLGHDMSTSQVRLLDTLQGPPIFFIFFWRTASPFYSDLGGFPCFFVPQGNFFAAAEKPRETIKNEGKKGSE